MERIEQAKEVWHKTFENIVDDTKGLTREQIASGFFELGWRAADENPPKGTSLIKWQTGEPKKTGGYLITTKTGAVWYDYWYCSIKKWERHMWDTIAWCPLNEIEPYKE